MTEATVEAPVLGLGPGGLQPYAQAALALSHALRDARLAAGRRAWSERESSDRDSEVTRRLAHPPVRAMSAPERDAWVPYVRSRSPEGAPPPGVSVRRAGVPDGSVTVTVAPMPNDPDAWGLHVVGPNAEAGEDGAAPRVETYVCCVDEVTAKRLGDDLLARGGDAVTRLDQFAHLAAQRAADAAARRVESGQHRKMRIAEILRSHWADHPQLVEKMIQPTEEHRRKGHQHWNPAFGALCHRIAQLEEHGYTVVEVLDTALSPTDLANPEIVNPAAFAEWLVKNEASLGGPIHLGALPEGNWGDDEQPERSADTGRRGDRQRSPRGDRGEAAGAGYDADAETPAPAVRSRLADRQQQARRRHVEVRNATVEPALAAAVDPELLRGLRGRKTYGLLLEDLYTRHRGGLPLAEQLADLPTARIAAANDPAAYMRSVLKRNAAARAAAAGAGAEAITVTAADATRPVGVDRAALAALLERAGGAEFAAAVAGSASWPGLAARLQTWGNEGLPLEAAVAALNHDHIRSAGDPASYAGRLLNSRFGALRRDQHTEDAHQSGQPRDSVDEQEPHATDPPAQVVDWRDLDPASAVDRVGLEAARGQGSVVDDAAIDTKLDGVLAPLFGNRADPAAPVADLDPGTSEAALGTSEAATTEAATTETRRSDGPGAESRETASQGSGVTSATRAAAGSGHAGVRLDENLAEAAARAARAVTPPAPGTGPAPRRNPSPTPRGPRPVAPVEQRSPEQQQSRRR